MKRLGDITAADWPRVGGKAYNCARLKQAGFPVPDALVVPADARDDDLPSLAGASWLDELPPGTRFAVRSSGLAEDSADDSFAGIHETALNVSRDRLVDAVRACRRSAQSEQARAYRAARHLSNDAARIAVLVQCMVPAVTSGVAFTVNPVTGADEIVVNSVAGLGEALVSGLVDPEERHLAKSDPSELARLLVGIEQHYGAPQDIEWCHDGTAYWIVQSRPVTTSRRTTPPPRPATFDIEWTRANLVEVFPDQLSPQALDTYRDLLEHAERAFFGNLMAPEAELGPIIKSFHGRLYFNLSQLRHVAGTVAVPVAGTLRSLGHSEQIRPEDEIAKKLQPKKLLRALPDLLRLARHDLQRARVFRNHVEQTREALARVTSVAPATQSDREIWSRIAWWIESGPTFIVPVLVMSSVQRREDLIAGACKRVGLEYRDLGYPYLAAGERSVSSQQAFDLIRLANIARRDPQGMEGPAFLREFEQFIARYGHRGHYESDWSIPRMHEDPSTVLFAIREQLNGPPQDPEAIAARQAAEAAEAMRAFESRLTTWQRWTLLPRVRAALQQLKQQYLWREQVRSDLTRVLAALRPWHLTLADRFVERRWLDRRDDYFLLHLAEVQRVCEDPRRGPELRAIAAGRAAERARDRDLAMPLFMRESQLAALLGDAAAPARADGDLTGLCVSPGCVDAEVVVMRDPSEFAMMKRGAILVTKATDPSWTPLFTLASGVIVEVGGMLSHASTIAREYGLPALANVKHATTTLRTGDRVRLDASAGRVIR
jgi:pyruvate,water dikinase